MEQFPFIPASQPTSSTPSFIFPQSLGGPSSLQPPLSSQYRLHDFLDSTLPQNTSRVLAESQASGRLSQPFNGPAGQIVRTAKTVAAAKHKTVRSGAQQNMWKAGSASTLPRGMPALRHVSQLPEVAQPQPLSVKARARRIAQAAKYRKTTTEFSHQLVTTTPSWRDDQQGASQGRQNSTDAAQAAAPQVEVTPISTHAGSSSAAVLSAAPWEEGEHGEGKSMSDWGLDWWATATAVQISRRCRLESLPLDLIEQVLPRFRAYLKKTEHSAGAKTSQTSTAQISAPVTLPLPQLPCPPSVETSESLPVSQLPAPFNVPEQATPFFPTEYPVTAPTMVAPGTEESAYDPGLWSVMDFSACAPETVSSTMAEPVLTYEELEALRQVIEQSFH
jgi:hypothetical protein